MYIYQKCTREENRNACEQSNSHYVCVDNVTGLKLTPISAGQARLILRLSTLYIYFFFFFFFCGLYRTESKVIKETQLIVFLITCRWRFQKIFYWYHLMTNLYVKIYHMLWVSYWSRKFPSDCPTRFPKDFYLAE